MRLAGTASQYSKKARPQLASTTTHRAWSLNFRWPYQAKVMKTFDSDSSRTVWSSGDIGGIGAGRRAQPPGWARRADATICGVIGAAWLPKLPRTQVSRAARSVSVR